MLRARYTNQDEASQSLITANSFEDQTFEYQTETFLPIQHSRYGVGVAAEYNNSEAMIEIPPAFENAIQTRFTIEMGSGNLTQTIRASGPDSLTLHYSTASALIARTGLDEGYLFSQTTHDGLNDSEQWFSSTGNYLGGSYGIHEHKANLGALDDLGNPLEITGDTSYTFVRDHQGRPISITDASGLTNTAAYDSCYVACPLT